MSLNLVLFIIFASISTVSAVLMITRVNPVISALFLILNFASLAGLYLLLNAQFIAIAQVIVYAGAIMVLFLFVIMLLKPEYEKKLLAVNKNVKIFAYIVAALVFLQLAYMIFFAKPSFDADAQVAASIHAGTIESIGFQLYSNYILPFEAAGYLLLAATIGALVLAKKKFE